MTISLSLFGIILAAFWGAIWALLLQRTAVGRYVAARLIWLSVVIGVGGDLLILLIVLPLSQWLYVCAVIGVSSIGVIVRSIYNEAHDAAELIRAVRDERDPRP